MIFLYAEAAFHSDSVDGKSGLTLAICTLNSMRICMSVCANRFSA